MRPFFRLRCWLECDKKPVFVRLFIPGSSRIGSGWVSLGKHRHGNRKQDLYGAKQAITERQGFLDLFSLKLLKWSMNTIVLYKLSLIIFHFIMKVINVLCFCHTSKMFSYHRLLPASFIKLTQFPLSILSWCVMQNTESEILLIRCAKFFWKKNQIMRQWQCSTITNSYLGVANFFQLLIWCVLFLI